MDFHQALKQTELDVKEAAAHRRTKTAIEPNNWMKFFPHLANDYSFCALTLLNNQGDSGAAEVEQALNKQVERSEEAWATLDRKARRDSKEVTFEPWEFLNISAVSRMDAPHCTREVWRSVDEAQEDYYTYFTNTHGKPSFEGKKEFETLYKTSDFVSSLAKTLRSQS